MQNIHNSTEEGNFHDDSRNSLKPTIMENFSCHMCRQTKWTERLIAVHSVDINGRG